MMKIIFLAIICFGTVLNIFSQAREITNEEYWQQYRAAAELPFKVSKRITSKEDRYENGKITSTTEIVDEFLKPDKRRYVETYKSGTSTKKSELIQVNKTYYCRTDNGEWKESNKWCASMSIKALSKQISSKFTVEETKIGNRTGKLYQQYITYKNEYSPNKDKEGLSYFQDKFWVDSDGYILRREMEIGLVEAKTISDKEVIVYEYNRKNIKIKAPILSNKKVKEAKTEK